MIYLIGFFIAIVAVAILFHSRKIEVKKCKCTNFEKCNEQNCSCDENCKCYDNEIDVEQGIDGILDETVIEQEEIEIKPEVTAITLEVKIPEKEEIKEVVKEVKPKKAAVKKAPAKKKTKKK